MLDALGTLADFSMVRWDAVGQAISMHRVVQGVLRTRIDGSVMRDWLHLSLRLLEAARPGNPHDVRTWRAWDLLRPHVALAVEQGDLKEITEPTAQLMSDLGSLLDEKALFTEAEPLTPRTLAGPQ